MTTHSEDTFGARLGYTVEDSHSGFNAARHHLLAYRTAKQPRLYSTTVGPLYTPRKVIEAVPASDIDVGPLDGYALDLVRRHEPDLVARLRVVATSALAAIPMLIASPDCPSQVVTALRSARSLPARHGNQECAGQGPQRKEQRLGDDDR